MPIATNRNLQSALSGAFLALPFLLPALWPLSFLGMFLFFVAQDDVERAGPAVRRGMLASVVLMTLLFYWVNYVLVVYGPLPIPVAATAFCLFVLLFGTKLPLLAWLLLRMRRLPLSRLITYPLAVMAVEMVQLSLFPWFFGSGQARNLYLLQIADVTGVVGLSAVLAVVGTAAGECWRRRVWLRRELGVAAAVLAVLYLYGAVRVAQVERAEASAPALHVALIQPNTPLRWDNVERTATHVIDTVQKLTDKACFGRHVDLMVWPEGGTPFSYNGGGSYLNAVFEQKVSELVRNHKFYLFFNDGLYEGGHLFNNVWLMAPNGSRIGNYQKIMLLAFGEYIPLGDTFPFLTKMAGIEQHTHGHKIHTLSMGRAVLAPQICYEILTPSFTRKFVAQGARCIVNVSDDAWFGPTSESLEHLMDALPRAVENRVPLIRCTNSGVSVMVSASGRLLTPMTPLFQEAVLTADIHPTQLTSFYARFGDVFGWLCTLAALGLIVWGRGESPPATPEGQGLRGEPPL
jgi:apolipoprotein N-acyltransferase